MATLAARRSPRTCGRSACHVLPHHTSGRAGTRREKSGVEAMSCFRFANWFSPPAANASRSAELRSPTKSVGGLSAERGAGYIPLLGSLKEDRVSQRIVHQIRRSIAMQQQVHRRGDDCWSPCQGRILSLIRSAEQRDEAERAGADESLFISLCSTCGTRCNRYDPSMPDCLRCGDANFVLGKR